MGKFCSYCGRPLEEGEVCNCQQGQQPQAEQPQSGQTVQPQSGQTVQPQMGQTAQQPQQQFNMAMGKAADATKALFSRIVPIIKSPVEELKAIAAAGSSKLGIQMILCNIIISFILLIIGMVVVRVKLGDMAEYISIPYAKIVLLGTIGIAAIYFAMAGLLFGFTKVFARGSQINFAQIITAVGGKALYDIAVLVISAVCMIISGSFGMFVFIAGMAFTYLLMIITYCEVVELKSSFKVYVLAVTYICMMLAFIIVLKLFVQSASDSIGSIFSDSLGGLLSGMDM